MDEDAIRRAVEALDNSEKERQLDVLYWYYHPNIPNKDKNAEIGVKVSQSGNWVWQKLNIIKGKFQVVGIYNIDDKTLAPIIQRIVNEVRDPEYQSQENRETTPPPPHDEQPVDNPPPSPPPEEPTGNGQSDDETPPPTPVIIQGQTTSGAGVNWRTFRTPRGALFLVLGVLTLVTIWAAITFNPFTGEPIDPPPTEVENPVEVADGMVVEEALPTPDRDEFNTRLAESMAATDTAEAPTVEFEQTRDAQIAFDQALAATTEARDQTATASVPTNTPTITPTPSNTPTITPIPPLLSADFESGNYAGWSVQGGDWVIDGDAGSGQRLMCLRRGTITHEGAYWDNYTISADVQFVTDTGVVGIVGRRSTPWDWYRADLKTEQVARLAENHQVNTQRADFNDVLPPVSFPVVIGQVYRLELRMLGIQLTVSVDGQEIINTTDNRHSEGYVGLFCGDDTIATFDNVFVNKIGN